MRVKLCEVGDRLGVVLDDRMLASLGIDRDTEIDVTTDGRRIILEPGPRRDERLGGIAQRVMDKHDPTFRKLAK